MSTMTPIKVRGKRTGTRSEKWHANKQRKRPVVSTPDTASVASSRASSAVPQKAKRRKVQLSRLEQLPTEIAQTIFEYSVNLDLPLASTVLAEQLSSRHLHHALTSAIVRPVLGFWSPKYAGKTERDNVTRLFSSRFMDWYFFVSWMRSEVETIPSSSKTQFVNMDLRYKAVDHVEDVDWHKSLDKVLGVLYASLGFSQRIVPPKKLLRGPWSLEAEQLLTLFVNGEPELDHVSLEIASQGYSEAVAQKRRGVVEQFRWLRTPVTQELLRQAILDDGCDQAIVLDLLHAALDVIPSQDRTSRRAGQALKHIDIDVFDSLLWAWADRALEAGNEKGSWLKKALRHIADYERLDSHTFSVRLALMYPDEQNNHRIMSDS